MKKRSCTCGRSQSTCYSIHVDVVLSDLEEIVKERVTTGCSQIVAAQCMSVLCKMTGSGYKTLLYADVCWLFREMRSCNILSME